MGPRLLTSADLSGLVGPSGCPWPVPFSPASCHLVPPHPLFSGPAQPSTHTGQPRPLAGCPPSSPEAVPAGVSGDFVILAQWAPLAPGLDSTCPLDGTAWLSQACNGPEWLSQACMCLILMDISFGVRFRSPRSLEESQEMVRAGKLQAPGLSGGCWCIQGTPGSCRWRGLSRTGPEEGSSEKTCRGAGGEWADLEVHQGWGSQAVGHRLLKSGPAGV